MSTTLEIAVSAGTLKKSKALLDNDQIQKIDDETFYVAGSKEGEIYEVGVHKIHGFVCNKTNASEPNEKGSLCMGWKNSRTPKICKHCYAVILFKKQEDKENSRN